MGRRLHRLPGPALTRRRGQIPVRCNVLQSLNCPQSVSGNFSGPKKIIFTWWRSVKISAEVFSLWTNVASEPREVRSPGRQSGTSVPCACEIARGDEHLAPGLSRPIRLATRLGLPTRGPNANTKKAIEDVG